MYVYILTCLYQDCTSMPGSCRLCECQRFTKRVIPAPTINPHRICASTLLTATPLHLQHEPVSPCHANEAPPLPFLTTLDSTRLDSSSQKRPILQDTKIQLLSQMPAPTATLSSFLHKS